MPSNPLPTKWRAFGWNVIDIDGHDMAQVVEALEEPRSSKVTHHHLARTVKGKGVSYMENV